MDITSAFRVHKIQHLLPQLRRNISVSILATVKTNRIFLRRVSCLHIPNRRKFSHVQTTPLSPTTNLLNSPKSLWNNFLSRCKSFSAVRSLSASSFAFFSLLFSSPTACKAFHSIIHRVHVMHVNTYMRGHFENI